LFLSISGLLYNQTITGTGLIDKLIKSRTEAKYLEPFKLLSEAIITNWNPEVFDKSLLIPTLGSNNDKIGYNKSWIYEY